MAFLTVVEAHKVIAEYMMNNPSESYRAVGEHFGYSQEAIAKIYREMGWPRRKPGRRYSKLEAK